MSKPTTDRLTEEKVLKFLAKVGNRFDTTELNLHLELKRAQRLNDRQEEQLDRVEKIIKAGVALLNDNLKAITERGIFDGLKKLERQERRRKRFYPGYPGVPRKKLEDDASG